MPITSMIVKCREDEASRVARTIAALPSASVTNVEGEQLVVITDTATREQDQALWDRIEALPEVVAITVVYHNFEDLAPGTSHERPASVKPDGEGASHVHGHESS